MDRTTLPKATARVGVAAALLAGTLACTGFLEDVEATGPDAERRIGAVAGGRLPPGVQGARVVETTGIDWLLVGEVTGPRADLDAWFDGLAMTCDQPDVREGPVAFDPMDILASGTWSRPVGASWRTRRCTGSTHSGPHVEVHVTADRDPAWAWIQAMTM